MQADQISRLALGTVQFGMHYGIANAHGQVGETTAQDILTLAKKSGINTLDTAIAYGESEAVLGKSDISSFDIVTKLPAIPQSNIGIKNWVTQEFNVSLERLNVESVDALLVHNIADIIGENGKQLFDALKDLQNLGKIKKLGWSVYSPADLEATPNEMKPDLVQLPFNIFDQRMFTSGWLDKLKENGIEVHARSAFLQGLLLMQPSERPAYFHEWQDIWNVWDKHTVSSDALATCLGFSLSKKQIDRVVIGVDSVAQLQQILSIDISDNSYPNLPDTMPEDLINPSRWNAA